jgi:hypothetical protein
MDFNDIAEQVAARDINNYIQYSNTEPLAENASWLVYQLLNKADKTGIRLLLERTCLILYGSRYFKSLTIGQLLTLSAIADEMIDVLDKAR